ncbi:MAG: KpsF/GutQ family sugar-phosphate isomerase, partial [Gammaproteobacteria bacterium]|nr:KpsF/GutQ family sugar-phosphate isomerase [Gammaproteobacteria bacterium]
CLSCKGRIVVTGMGKSGHVGSKIAATLASTGSPAFFVHPGEAGHGDMGMMKPNDVVLAISNSGETSEIITLLPVMKRMRIPLITMTGSPTSTMAKAATVNLHAGVDEEACPLNLAPTASTTAALALGDALAVALLTARGFTADDFARSHPSGSLGKRLLLTVADVMHTDDEIPVVGPDTSLSKTLLVMSEKQLGMTIVIDENNYALGVFTDGDLRRALDKKLDVGNTKARDVMTGSFKSITPEFLAVEALNLFETHRITALPVLGEKGDLVGALNIHDLFRAGVV